jgi:hypothetical protein
MTGWWKSDNYWERKALRDRHEAQRRDVDKKIETNRKDIEKRRNSK